MKKTPLYNYVTCVAFVAVSLFTLVRWYQTGSQTLLVVGIVCAVLFIVLLDFIIRGGPKSDPIVLKEGEKIIKEYSGVSVKKTSILSWAILLGMDVTVTDKRIYLNQGRRISSLSLVYKNSDLFLFSKLNAALITDARLVNDEVYLKMRGGWLPLNLTWKIKNDANFIYDTVENYRKS